MKKLIKYGAILLLVMLFMTTIAYALPRNLAFTVKTGGGTDSLDSYYAGLLEDKSLALVTEVAGGFSVYLYDIDSAVADDGDDTITPDENSDGVPYAGDGRWIKRTSVSGVNTGDNTVATSGDSATAFFDAGTIEAARLVDGNNNIASVNHHLTGTVVNPNGAYALDHEICIWLATDAAVTVTSIKVTCDADPTTELDIDLKFCDAFIGQANATIIDVCDTTTGTTSIASGFDDATVPSGKCIMLVFGAEPDSAITQFSFDITYDYD